LEKIIPNKNSKQRHQTRKQGGEYLSRPTRSKSMKKKQAKIPFAVKPTIYAACVELCKGNAAAGGLLCQIQIRSEGNTLSDEKSKKGWLVLSSTQWRCVTGFSRHRYDNALKLIKKIGVIESRRRKLNYKDPAALTWIRLTDLAKSEIKGIMSRNAISAFEKKNK
jgi:hypothetical protein